ncbi:MAG: cytochrome c oxidase assembly protein [Alphaproteobacteria bacterium]
MSNKHNKNISLAINLLAIVAGMVLLAYASVPLYRLFCAVTGYGGTTQSSVALPDKIYDREITVRFNADIDPALDWGFKPGEKKQVIKIGESALTYYVAKNKTNRPIIGHATYNVVPHKAGQYFVKVACFCFEEQTLQAKQEVNMPISYYIDPAIMDDPEMNDVQTITLSYTFFPLKE